MKLASALWLTPFLVACGTAHSTARTTAPQPTKHLQLATPPPLFSATAMTQALVTDLMRTYHRPGVAIAVTENGAVVWQHAYGVANIENHEALSISTIFPVCSLSKPVMLVAVMQTVERLARERSVPLSSILDENIETLVASSTEPLPPIRLPDYPAVPITLRMLLGHVSGIRDGYLRAPHHIAVAPPTFLGKPKDLRVALAEYLRPAGAYYGEKNFVAGPPGTHFAYSSIASSLTALIVDEHSAQSFAMYTQVHVFDPLNMHSTSWRLADLVARTSPGLSLALPYQWREVAPAEWRNTVVAPIYWEHTFFPTASLRTTVGDYALFVAALAGNSLLAPSTMNEIMRVQYPSADYKHGLILDSMIRNGLQVFGHDGQNDGYRSEMFFTRASDTPGGAVFGVVILTNGDTSINGSPLESALGSTILQRALAGTLGDTEQIKL